MALRLLAPGRRAAVLYGRSLRQISSGLRALSTKDDVGHDGETVVEVRQMFPSPASDLLGDTDRRLPLPGGVGLAEELAPVPPQPPPSQRQSAVHDSTVQLYHDRHMAALVSLLTPTSDQAAELSDDELPEVPPGAVLLEIQAHDCPQLLKEEFRSLFTERDITAGRLTVLVVSQRTDADMATWSEEIDVERADLANHFVTVGRDIVLSLRRLGFWADLVDPRSGRPHLGGSPAPRNSVEGEADTLLETDQRLARLGAGFTIDDLGCCKVVQHSVWGSHVFVGCMFTDAAVDDPRLDGVISQYQHLAPSS